MTWYAWALAVFISLNAFIKVALVGQRKDPDYHSAGEAVVTLIYSVLAVWAIISLAS